MIDSRMIDYKKVIELVEERINTDYFKCGCFYPDPDSQRQTDDYHYLFYIHCKTRFQYSFYYTYDPFNMKIKDMNKLLKKKNNGKGIIVEKLVADEIYNGFMSDWISLAKPKTNKE